MRVICEIIDYIFIFLLYINKEIRQVNSAKLKLIYEFLQLNLCEILAITPVNGYNGYIMGCCPLFTRGIVRKISNSYKGILEILNKTYKNFLAGRNIKIYVE